MCNVIVFDSFVSFLIIATLLSSALLLHFQMCLCVCLVMLQTILYVSIYTVPTTSLIKHWVACLLACLPPSLPQIPPSSSSSFRPPFLFFPYMGSMWQPIKRRDPFPRSPSCCSRLIIKGTYTFVNLYKTCCNPLHNFWQNLFRFTGRPERGQAWCLNNKLIELSHVNHSFNRSIKMAPQSLPLCSLQFTIAFPPCFLASHLLKSLPFLATCYIYVCIS